MNFYLVENSGGDLGERVKALTRFTDSEFAVNLTDARTARSLGICKTQSGITHSHQSPPNPCLKIFISALG